MSYEQKCVLAQEVIALRFTQNWKSKTKRYLGILKPLIGPLLNRPLASLLVNLRNVLHQEEFIGSAVWNSSLTSLSRMCKSVPRGVNIRDVLPRILKDVRVLQYNLEITAIKLRVASTILRALRTVNSNLSVQIRIKYTGMLCNLQHTVNAWNTLKNMLQEISSYSKTKSYNALRRFIIKNHQTIVAIGSSRWLKYPSTSYKHMLSFCTVSLVVGRLLTPSPTFEDLYLSATLTTLRRSQRKQMELSSMICHSNTGPGLPVSTSSTSSMTLHYQRGMYPQQSVLDYQDFSLPMKRLRMFSTALELADASKRRLYYDEQKGTMFCLHSLYLKNAMNLDAGVYVDLSALEYELHGKFLYEERMH